MALSDFMPYGAPEQLEGAAQRMACAHLVASLAVALLFTASGALMGRSLPQVATVVPEPRGITLDPPPTIMNEPKVRAVPQVRPAKLPSDPHARAEIVDDKKAMDELVERSQPALPEAPTGELEGVDILASTGSGTGITPARDPEPGEYVVVDEFPAPVDCPEPRYPDLAREAGVEGVVRVQILVGLDGRAERAIVAPGGSVLLLDEAALEAALRCVFTPALTNRRPVKVWVSQRYRFTLH